jgi:hypothetical protein
MKKNLVGYKTLRTFIKKEVSGHVSAKAIEFLQLHIENEIKQICQDAIKEQRVENEFREFHRLPKLRRTGVSVFKKVSTRLHKESYVDSIEEHGDVNRKTCFSQAEKEVI